MRIMANINETISEVAKLNPELARQIQKYVKDHLYGLVFEHNLPEAVRLYKKQPAVGDTVNILAPRGQKETEENSVPWCVKYIDNGVAYLEHDGEAKDVPLEDICVLVSYRDVIYPGLKEIDRIERGNPEDPYHMVINSENYHALEALAYAERLTVSILTHHIIKKTRKIGNITVIMLILMISIDIVNGLFLWSDV